MQPLHVLPRGAGLALLFAAFAAACSADPHDASSTGDPLGDEVDAGVPDAPEDGDVVRVDQPMTEASLVAACGDGAPAEGAAIDRDPYVQHVTSTSAIVGWTSTTTAAQRVEVTTPAGAPVATAAAVIEDTVVPSSSVQQRWAAIDGLAPGTIYCYALASDAGAMTARAGFRTAPAADSDATVRFVAFGDSGTGGPDQRAVFEQMRKVPQDLIVHVGDIAYSSGTITELEQRTFDVYGPLLRHVPLFGIAGNHEHETDGAAPFRAVFSLPGNERWYSFDWGNVHFAGLDTELDLDVQAAWLEADLAATDRPWKVVFLHAPPYSSGDHGSYEYVRDAFASIMERHGVQLVLTGHDHHYERTAPMNDITYIVTGGGGGGLRAVEPSDFTAASASVFHFLQIEVEGDQLTVHAIDDSGVEFDTVVIPRE